MVQLKIVSLKYLGQKFAAAKELSQHLNIPIQEAFKKIDALVQCNEPINVLVEGSKGIMETQNRLEAVGLEVGSINPLVDPWPFDPQKTDMEHGSMWTTELKNYALVKRAEDDSYTIHNLSNNGYLIIESFREQAYIVQKLLEHGAMILDDFPR